LGDYLIVRQSDAHAWAEVWLTDRGWVRIDPTAAVAPERIERRIDLGGTRVGDPVRFELPDLGLFGQTLRRTRLGLDAVNNGWNQWVLSYGPDQQRDLLSGLGFRDADWRALLRLLVIAALSGLAVLAIVLLRRPHPSRDEPVQLYARFRRRLRR